MSPDLPARLQFAAAALTHGLFAAVSIGLVLCIAVLQTMAHRRGDADLLAAARRWAAPYVVVYVVGIAAGMVLEVQFGLSWAGLVDRAGNVVGAVLTVEVLTTFIVESTLLALWTFGWGVLPARLHLALVWGVVATAVLSVFWSLVSNSFLQDPRGFALRDGVVELTDPLAILGGPTLWVSLVHVVGASALVGGGLLAAGGAVLLRRSAREGVDGVTAAAAARLDLVSVRVGCAVAAAGAVATVVAGVQSLGYLETTQPGKAVLLTGGSAAREAVAAELAERYGAGTGLPPAWIVAPAAVMVLAGLAAAAVAVWALAGGLDDAPAAGSRPGGPDPRAVASRPAVRLLPVVGLLPLAAVAAGWLVREVGRQPWVVHGVLRTDEVVSATGPARAVATLVAVALVSAVLLVVAARWGWRALLAAREGTAPGTAPTAAAGGTDGGTDGGGAPAAAPGTPLAPAGRGPR